MKKLFASLLFLFAASAFAGITPPLVDSTARTALSGSANDSTARTALSGSANDSTARTSASTAQSTANTAVSNAATAQTTANNASAGSFYGATMHNMVGSRAFGSSYTNSTGKVMHVNVQATNGSTPYIQVSGVNVCQVLASTTWCSFIVPAGAVYSSTVSGGVITIWSELY